jgi:two-component system nitrate/nitrite sensor histidine kinase NarX
MSVPGLTERLPQRLPHPALMGERARWAMFVHDTLTQSVTSAVLELRSLRARMETDPEGALATLEKVERTIADDLRRIRDVLFALGDETAVAPVEPGALASFIDEVVTRWGLHARVSVEGDLSGVSAEVLDAATGIIAEALANTAKHAGSPDVAVRVIRRNGTVRIVVEDRGSGKGPTPHDERHFGSLMMQERAASVGGTCKISTPGSGTRVVATLPAGGG